MIKIKPVVICASLALALSFFISLFSRNAFPLALLKAVIFAVVFGGLAVGIQVVYEKFLSDGEAPVSESTETPQKVVGSKVDLVVSEEDLPNEENAPTFSLGSTRHVLTAADVGFKPASPQESASEQEAASVAASSSSDDVAKPSAEPGNESVSEARALEVAASSAQQVSAANSEAANVPASPAGNSAPHEPPKSSGTKSSSVGDELPDLDSFPALDGGDSEDKQDAEEESVIEDSDFAEEDSPSPMRRTEFPDGTVADSKDASLMAEAIRTVLVKDE